MYSFLSVINESSGTIGVFLDDEVFFTDILPGEKTKPKRVLFSSCRVIITDRKEKMIFDLWLPVKKETSHTLTVRNTSFVFK